MLAGGRALAFATALIVASLTGPLAAMARSIPPGDPAAAGTRAARANIQPLSTPRPTPTPTPTPTPSPSNSPTAHPTPTGTPVPLPVPVPPSPTATTAAPAASPTAAVTPLVPTDTPQPTDVPSNSPAPPVAPTATPEALLTPSRDVNSGSSGPPGGWLPYIAIALALIGALIAVISRSRRSTPPDPFEFMR